MASETAGCQNLTLGLDPSCEALKKPGGIGKRVWIGQNSQLDSYTINEDTLDIQTISLDDSTSPVATLKKFISKKFKNSTSTPLEVGENINVFNQTVNLALYFKTSLEKSAIEALANAEDVFVIVEEMGGDLVVYGIEVRGSASSDNPLGGLNASAGEGGSGLVLNDPTSYQLTLTGQHTIMNRNFNISPTATLAQNIAYLDAISA